MSNEQQLSTYSTTRYNSLAKQDEVSLVCGYMMI